MNYFNRIKVGQRDLRFYDDTLEKCIKDINEQRESLVREGATYFAMTTDYGEYDEGPRVILTGYRAKTQDEAEREAKAERERKQERLLYLEREKARIERELDT